MAPVRALVDPVERVEQPRNRRKPGEWVSTCCV